VLFEEQGRDEKRSDDKENDNVEKGDDESYGKREKNSLSDKSHNGLLSHNDVSIIDQNRPITL